MCDRVAYAQRAILQGAIATAERVLDYLDNCEHSALRAIEPGKLLEPEPCKTCKGSGRETWEVQLMNGATSQTTGPCQTCNGTGNKSGREE